MFYKSHKGRECNLFSRLCCLRLDRCLIPSRSIVGRNWNDDCMCESEPMWMLSVFSLNLPYGSCIEFLFCLPHLCFSVQCFRSMTVRNVQCDILISFIVIWAGKSSRMFLRYTVLSTSFSECPSALWDTFLLYASIIQFTIFLSD